MTNMLKYKELRALFQQEATSLPPRNGHMAENMVHDSLDRLFGLIMQLAAREHAVDAGLLREIQRLDSVFIFADMREVDVEASLFHLKIALQTQVRGRNAVP